MDKIKIPNDPFMIIKNSLSMCSSRGWTNERKLKFLDRMIMAEFYDTTLQDVFLGEFGDICEIAKGVNNEA